jgi:hypothetical protein
MHEADLPGFSRTWNPSMRFGLAPALLGTGLSSSAMNNDATR